MPQAATIKQAKAAYKSRAEQPLTEREKKQLERSIQLERRAWGLREREKNKLDLAKKRAAEEKAQKDEARRIGTQRRNDKFGFKSSQFHLGAFFRRPMPAPSVATKEQKNDGVNEQSNVSQHATSPEVNMTEDEDAKRMLDDDSQDDYEDVDDESLLEALQSPEVVRHIKKPSDVRTQATNSMPPPPRPAFTQSTHKPPNSLALESEDLGWQDFLESSTQIARELSTEAPAKQLPPAQAPAAKETLRTGSFSSGSFELTEDDIEQLDPTPRAHVQCNTGQTKVASERVQMPPPPLPLKQRAQGSCGKGPREGSKQEPLGEPKHAQDDLGFSMTQLESFVEDDLQLTQAQ